MTLAYEAKLSLKICATNIKAQKVDDFTLEMFEIVLSSCHVKNKLKNAWLIQKTFLVANTGMPVILDMLFLFFTNANFLFFKWKLF